jgi:small subunit ribosomal protein S16
MLAIKFKRTGKKHQAAYRVVVAEKKSKLRGADVEDLGWVNPHAKKFELNKERTAHWLKVGAQPTNTVHNLLVRAGILREKKVAVHGTKKVAAKAA